jgi:hypothetical protein
LPFCPSCGKEVPENAIHCPHCGERIRAPATERVGAGEHLSIAFRIVTEKPLVFAPVIISGLISVVIDNIGGRPFLQSGFSPLLFFAGIISLVGSIINYLLSFASIDMSRDAYMDEPLDLMDSINYVISRIGTFIVASILGAVMAITIILIPVVLFMFVIIVMDETSIGVAVSRSFSVLSRDLSDIILILIIAIVGSAVLGFVPLISGLLNACYNVVIGLAFIDVYNNYKKGF